jgi:hypothetical protein
MIDILADALSLAMQDLNLHLIFRRKHREQTFAVQVGQFSTGRVGQFWTGADTEKRILGRCRAESDPARKLDSHYAEKQNLCCNGRRHDRTAYVFDLERCAATLRESPAIHRRSSTNSVAPHSSNTRTG